MPRLRSLALLLCCATFAGAADFRLVVPGTRLESKATLTTTSLVITDTAGNTFRYARENRYDTRDGKYLGFYSATTRQAVRWPVSGTGRMLVGRSAGAGLIFQPSRMEVQPIPVAGPFGGTTGGTGTAGGTTGTTAAGGTATGPASGYRMLTTQQGAVDGTSLDVAPTSGETRMSRAADVAEQHWQLVSVGKGLYRIHCEKYGTTYCLDVGSKSRLVRVRKVVAGDDYQLFKPVAVTKMPGYFHLVSAAAAYADYALESGAGTLRVRRVDTVPTQYWSLSGSVAPAPAPAPPAGYKLLKREVVPNAALDPVKVELVNSHKKELWVLVTDLRNPSTPLRIRLPAGASQAVQFERDPGGTLVETFEILVPRLGVVEQRQRTTPIPPAALYDISVYELILQSVAVDSTVPGGRVERANYSPKSLGFFPIPAGSVLTGGQTDIYRVATSQRNPGQVRTIDPKLWKTDAEKGPEKEDPLEKALREASGG